jgi:serine phosphatase RsbU (regulator of sigma subunit)
VPDKPRGALRAHDSQALARDSKRCVRAQVLRFAQEHAKAAGLLVRTTRGLAGESRPLRGMRRATHGGVLKPAWTLTDALLAHELKRVLMPVHLVRSDFEIASMSRPAEDVGGDFFVLVPREHGVCVVIGDVCGAGRGAARIAARIQPHVYTLAHLVNDPGDLLAALNRVAGGIVPQDRFITAAALELDGRRGELMIANAGHVPPMIRRRSGGTIVVGRASGPPLGMLKNARYARVHDRLSIGDIAVLMTDGVLEAIESDLTTMRTLAGLLAEAPEGAAAVNRSIFSFVDRQCGERKLDDRTVLSIERSPRRFAPGLSRRAGS